MISMFYDSIARYITNMGYQDVVEVINVDEGIQYGGGCETCSYEYIAITVTYKDNNGKSRDAEISGTFVDLINSLD